MLPSISARSYQFGKLSSLDDDVDYSTGHGYYGNNSILWNSTKSESSSEEATDDDDGDDNDDDGDNDDDDEVEEDCDMDRSKNSDESGDQEKPPIDDIEKSFQELTTN